HSCPAVARLRDGAGRAVGDGLRGPAVGARPAPQPLLRGPRGLRPARGAPHPRRGGRVPGSSPALEQPRGGVRRRRRRARGEAASRGLRGPRAARRSDAAVLRALRAGGAEARPRVAARGSRGGPAGPRVADARMPGEPARGARAAVAAGLLLGCAVAAGLFACDKGFVEREEYRPHATGAEVAEWQAEWDRRAKPHAAVPDPPGEGPVVSARYWLSRAVYEMEIRRRGGRAVVNIHGIDVQVMGGGWTAFGEGTITGEPSSFRGAEARIHWSCLGIRYRSAS